MANDYENMLRLLMRSRQDPKLAGALEKLGGLLDSPEGRNMMGLLSAGGTDVIKNASDAALRGDKAAAKAALARLLSTKEGSAFAARLAELFSGH